MSPTLRRCFEVQLYLLGQQKRRALGQWNNALNEKVSSITINIIYANTARHVVSGVISMEIFTSIKEECDETALAATIHFKPTENERKGSMQ